MPTTKQATLLANHLQANEWEQALVLVRQVLNVQTLKQTFLAIWNSSEVPQVLVYAILCRIKYLSRLQGKTFPVGLYPFMFQEKFHDLWRDASVETCTAFLRALSGDYPTSATSWPQARSLKEEINTLWRRFLELPHMYHSSNRVTGNEEHIQQLVSVHSLDDLEQVPEVKSLWLKTVVLLKAYLKVPLQQQDDNNNDEWLVVHAIAEVDCLLVVMWFALKLYPHQISTRDTNGNLPIHIAASKPVFCEQEYRPFHRFDDAPLEWFHERNNYPLALQQAEEINMGVFLCQEFPEGATYMDAQGHVPLLVSLLTLVKQKMVQTKNNYCFSHVQELRRLQTFMEAAPQVLASRDYESKLYPFQLAACHSAPLDSIYTLFRSDPSSLKFRTLTRREADYERVLMENDALKQELREKNALLKHVQEKLEQYEKMTSGKKRSRPAL